MFPNVAGVAGLVLLVLLWVLMMALALWGISRLLPTPRRQPGPLHHAAPATGTNQVTATWIRADDEPEQSTNPEVCHARQP